MPPALAEPRPSAANPACLHSHRERSHDTQPQPESNSRAAGICPNLQLTCIRARSRGQGKQKRHGLAGFQQWGLPDPFLFWGREAAGRGERAGDGEGEEEGAQRKGKGEDDKSVKEGSGVLSMKGLEQTASSQEESCLQSPGVGDRGLQLPHCCTRVPEGSATAQLHASTGCEQAQPEPPGTEHTGSQDPPQLGLPQMPGERGAALPPPHLCFSVCRLCLPTLQNLPGSLFISTQGTG